MALALAGLVSRDARGVASRRAGALRRAAPLLLLGGARLGAVAATGYVVPVGEYGAHWNFFFTLAAVAALAAAAPAPARGGAASAAAAAAAVLGAHEAALRGGIAAWLDAPRGADLLSRNREGICSVVRRAPARCDAVASLACLTRARLAARSRAIGGCTWAASPWAACCCFLRLPQASATRR